VDAGNAGEALFVRVERQTLSRLPRTGAILFTIHTRSRPLAAVAGEPGRARRLLDAVRTMPPEMARYKGIAPLRDALAGYLEPRAREPRRGRARPTASPYPTKGGDS
jgi:hypothetical protein